MKKIAIFSCIFLLFSCKKEENISASSNNNSNNIVKGKNRFTLTSEGVEREYFVHVPNGYTGNSNVPLVVFFHGTGQNGEQFYNISGWKEVGETENIFTVFPSSLKYCITEDGTTQTTPKWTGYADSYSYCQGTVMKDDLKFMRLMLAELQSKYKIDAKKIYSVGFSNGGELSAKCAVEMSDVFAAAISSGGGGALPSNIASPARMMPVMLMFGNMDEKILRSLSIKTALPMNFTTLYNTYPGLYGKQPQPYINTFKLDEKNYTVSGDPANYIIGNFVGLSGNPSNVFKLVEVKDLIHEYPNGKNHPLNGAALHWEWLKQFKLP